MRPNTRYTRVRFHLVRLARRAELVWWYFLAWCVERRLRYCDRRIAQGLARDPQRYGRRPYERNADVFQDGEW